MVIAKTRRGEIKVPARVTKEIMKGVMFMPFHFAECAANILTNNALDPIAKIPEFKACAIKIEKIQEA
jgi:formate dehydrogenase, alpha subunit (F420) (EC 1.2.99.-)